MALKRGVLLMVGLISLLLGVIGIVVPLLPTVPFILLAAFCFARSSSRLHAWLMRHPWFTDALQDWESKRAMRKGLKRKAYVATSISFAISIALVPLLWVKVMLLCMVTLLLLYLRQIPELEE
ncbi:YbaN family protein [Shewanella algidipiscicola]|uniref:Inner membrane protein n=1 Tax=Shewanella algidipiscicola TaxID=614070 RepID=A0ABQ4P618_9GAMM|nr:YbaN family protein [Shewanella algidipiscicola]GIU42920.1 inner membrane protein [Shewanella algidipiscicola]